jgi:hypothetical protein
MASIVSAETTSSNGITSVFTQYDDGHVCTINYPDGYSPAPQPDDSISQIDISVQPDGSVDQFTQFSDGSTQTEVLSAGGTGDSSAG